MSFAVSKLTSARLCLRNITNQTYSTAGKVIYNGDGEGFGFTKEDILTARPYSDLPGPKILPVIGNFFSFKPFGNLDAFDRVACCKMLQDRYGPISRLSLPLIPTMNDVVEVLDPADFELVYRNVGRHPERTAQPVLEKYRRSRNQGLGLFISNGEEWWKFRQPLNKGMMKANAANPYLSIQDPIGDELISTLKIALNNGNGRHPTIMKDVFRWALESVCAIVFDRRLGCMDPDLKSDSWQQEFIDSVHTSFQLMYSLTINPIFKVYDYVGYKAKKQIDLERNMDYITDTSLRLVEEAKDAWSGIPEKELQTKFLAQLLNIEGLSIEQKVSVIFDMLLAAIDTTTYTTFYNLFHLAKNPEIQEKLHAEINEHIGEDGGELNPMHLSKLHYLRACIKESHRMNPIAPTNARILKRDIVLKGYMIPKGTTFLLEHQHASTSSKFVDEPESFKPERWLRSEFKDGEKIPPFLVLPFGFGPRMCIGKRFAEQELYIALIKLVKHFRFEYDGEKLPLKGPGLDKLPKKLDFIIHER